VESQKAKDIFINELFPHLEALKTYAYHLTYNESEADDLVQETYLNAHKAINSFIPGTNAKAWLFRILRNAYINGYRKKTRQPYISSIEEEPQAGSTSTANKVGSDDLRKTLFDKALGDEVTKALAELPEEFREIIVMCDIEDLTYDEISKTLDLPLGTVRSRIFRARNMLKSLLKNYATGLGYKDYRGGDAMRDDQV
jgi:RNA polymerase sigma-70 factor (ECF subfamily)